MTTPSYTAFLDEARSQIQRLAQSADDGSIAAFEARVTAMSPAAREVSYEDRHDALAAYLGASAANQCSDDPGEQEDAIAAAEDLATSLLEARQSAVAIAIETWLQSSPDSAAPKVTRGMTM